LLRKSEYTISSTCTIRSAHALNYVVENVTVSLHYWYHACDETLDGQAAQLAAYFCRLHCVFHLTVHGGSILMFLNVAYAMHYDVFTWLPIQNNKGVVTWTYTILVTCGIKSESFCHCKPSVSSILPFAIHCCIALGLLNLPCFHLRSVILSKTVRVIFFIKSC
jgi:hypothetical protein